MLNYHNLGYICVTSINADEDDFSGVDKIYIRANKITSVDLVEYKGRLVTRIFIQNGDGHCTFACESVEDIFAQLENIHPDMR